MFFKKLKFESPDEIIYYFRTTEANKFMCNIFYVYYDIYKYFF